MSIKTLVASRLNAPKIERTDLVDTITYIAPTITPEPITDTGDTFREFLAEHRGEQSSRGRVASRVLRMGFGARPCKQGVAELMRLQLSWMPAVWVQLFQEAVGKGD